MGSLRMPTVSIAFALALTITPRAEARWFRFFTPPPPPAHADNGCSYDTTSGGNGGTPAVPEPASIALMGIGTAAVLYARRRRNKASDDV